MLPELFGEQNLVFISQIVEMASEGWGMCMVDGGRGCGVEVRGKKTRLIKQHIALNKMSEP